MGNLGLPEFIIIFLIIVFLFGAKRIPDIFKAVASGIQSFKKGLRDGKDKD